MITSCKNSCYSETGTINFDSCLIYLITITSLSSESRSSCIKSISKEFYPELTTMQRTIDTRPTLYSNRNLIVFFSKTLYSSEKVEIKALKFRRKRRFVRTIGRKWPLPFFMKIVEYRIIIPTNVTQYQIGNLYMCAMRSKEETGNGEGIEIVNNDPYEEDGVLGRYTYKIMHLKSKCPPAIRWAIPDKYLHIHEKSYNTYPRFKTVYTMPGMGDDFYMSVESIHIPYSKDTEVPENFFNLSEKELKKRKVVYQDIVNGEPAPAKPEWDMHNLYKPEAGMVEPLQTPENIVDPSKPPEWTQHYKGEMMMAIKVVKLKFKKFGLQSLVEKFAIDIGFTQTFIDSHRAMMAWADKWYPMNMDQIRELEDQIQREINQVEFDKE